MRYILLDMDGVMIEAKLWSVTKRLSDGMNEFTIDSVKKLNQLLGEKPSTIILSTSHRNRFSNNEWISILTNRGVHVTDIEKMKRGYKLDRISEWVSQNSTLDYLVIDDDKRLINIVPKDKLILTDSILGLK